MLDIETGMALSSVLMHKNSVRTALVIGSIFFAKIISSNTVQIEETCIKKLAVLQDVSIAYRKCKTGLTINSFFLFPFCKKNHCFTWRANQKFFTKRRQKKLG